MVEAIEFWRNGFAAAELFSNCARLRLWIDITLKGSERLWLMKSVTSKQDQYSVNPAGASLRITTASGGRKGGRRG